MLDLDDRLEQHLDTVANGSPTLRRMLCHLSGLQREAGEMFVSGQSPTEEELVASLKTVEFVLPPARAIHYSNRRSRCSARSWPTAAACRTRGMSTSRFSARSAWTRTTWRPQQPIAEGYLVDEYARTVWTEPQTDLGGTAAAGQLWSTVEDLCRWATFLARGEQGVLASSSVEEMWFPQLMYYPDEWIMGWGLGLQLFNRDGKILGGHGGAMPGHLSGVYIHRRSGVGAAAVTNSGARADMDDFPISLVQKAQELWPEPIEPWRPESEPPADVRALLGRWWSEGTESVFWWERGTLQAKVVGTSPGRGETTFERDGERVAWPRRAASAASDCASRGRG